MSFTKPNRTGKSTANDVVMTPRAVAAWVVRRYSPTGVCLEPARGSADGAFFTELPSPKLWCEITEGVDFLRFTGSADWIITNPPFSIYDAFLLKSLAVAANVVFLAPLQKVFKSRKIDDAISRHGGLREVVFMGGGTALGFPFGFPCGCLYFQRGYRGPVDFVRAYDWATA